MLSESEQQRLADIEAALRNDTRFVNGFNRAMTRRVTPRRITAVAIAVAGVLGAVVGLAAGSVAGTVLAICAVGVAGGVWTWRAAAPTRSPRHHITTPHIRPPKAPPAVGGRCAVQAVVHFVPCCPLSPGSRSR